MAPFLPFGDGYRLLKTPAALWVRSPPSLPEVPPFSATKVWQPGPPSGPGKAGGLVPRVPCQRLSVPDVKLVKRIRAEPHVSSSRLFIIVLCSRYCSPRWFTGGETEAQRWCLLWNSWLSAGAGFCDAGKKRVALDPGKCVGFNHSLTT